MLNIIIHQRNTNQNHNEIQLYTHNNGYMQMSDNNKYVKKSKLSYIAVRNINVV